jgi:hypothetical protein
VITTHFAKIMMFENWDVDMIKILWPIDNMASLYRIILIKKCFNEVCSFKGQLPFQSRKYLVVIVLQSYHHDPE